MSSGRVQQEEEGVQAESDGIYVELAQELIKNRVNLTTVPEQEDPTAGGAVGGGPAAPLMSPTGASTESQKQGHAHQLRIYQCLRILCRDELLCQSILTPELPTIQKLVAKLINLAQICINGSNHL